jgi:hypothetical protein
VLPFLQIAFIELFGTVSVDRFWESTTLLHQSIFFFAASGNLFRSALVYTCKTTRGVGG